MGATADPFGWEAFDPHYRQTPPRGAYDTVVCNHVANMLTRASRRGCDEELEIYRLEAGSVFEDFTDEIEGRLRDR